MANNPFVEFVEQVDNWNSLLRSLEFIRNNSVYVGIPDESTDRKEKDGITNAELLFIHTNGTQKSSAAQDLYERSAGSPMKGIPPRPVIEPAIENDLGRLNKMLEKSAKFAFDGKINQARIELGKVGMRGQNVCRDWFYNPENGWPPDSEETIKRKKAKHKTEGYEPRTLIDTSQLKNSITYFVKTKGGKTK